MLRPSAWRRLASVLTAATLAFLVVAATAEATFPGTNGRIVFAEKPPGTTGPQIASVDPGGANRIQLTTAQDRPPVAPDCGFTFNYQFDPSWSPDGASIVYVNYSRGTYTSAGPPCVVLEVVENQKVFRMNADGTGARFVAPNQGQPGHAGDPVFGPDGATITYECFVPTQQGVDICSLGGSSIVGPTGDYDPTYASDGRLFWVRDQTIWVRLTNSFEQQLDLGGLGATAPSVSPDGHSLAFAGTDGDIHIADFATIATTKKLKKKGRHKRRRKPCRKTTTSISPTLIGSVRNLTQTPGATEASPVFSPDGTQIAFIRDGVIQVMPASGGPSRQLTLPYPVFSLNWGPVVSAPPPALPVSSKSKCAKKHRRHGEKRRK